MYTVSIISKPHSKSRHVRTDTHRLKNFPNWFDMVRLCKKDKVCAVDFEHRRINDRFFVGKIYSIKNPKEGNLNGERYGVRFYVKSDKPVKLGDLVR